MSRKINSQQLVISLTIQITRIPGRKLTPTKIRRILSLSQMVDQAALAMVVAPVVVVAQAVDQEVVALQDLVAAQAVDQEAAQAVDQEAAQAVDQEAAAHPDLVVALQIHKYNQPIIT